MQAIYACKYLGGVWWHFTHFIAQIPCKGSHNLHDTLLWRASTTAKSDQGSEVEGDPCLQQPQSWGEGLTAVQRLETFLCMGGEQGVGNKGTALEIT